MGIGNGNELRGWAFARIGQAKARAAEAAASDILGKPQAVIAAVVEEFDFEPIGFDPASVSRSDVAVVGGLQQVVVSAPMSGGVALLSMPASRSRMDLPHARVHADRVEVDVRERRIEQQHIDQVVGSLVEHVEWVNADLVQHRQTLRDAVTNVVDARRAKLGAAADAQAALTTPAAVAAPVQVVETPRPPRFAGLRRRVARGWGWVVVAPLRWMRREWNKAGAVAGFGLVIAVLALVGTVVGVVIAYRSLQNDLSGGRKDGPSAPPTVTMSSSPVSTPSPSVSASPAAPAVTPTRVTASPSGTSESPRTVASASPTT